MSRITDFEGFFHETEAMIYNLGLRLFRNNEEDALDFAQDVYLLAYDKQESFEGRSKASTWLYTLALNKGLRDIKKSKRLKKFLPRDESDDIEGLQAPAENQPDQAVINLLHQQELSSQIEAALDELPESWRLPLILHFYEQMSYKEISQQLDIPEGTLKANVYRAKLQLRNTLKKDLL